MDGESLTNIESLPDDLVFAILVQLLPQDIQNGARLVCRKWYRIINSPDFIYANLQYSPPGLFIQYPCGDRRLDSIFVTMQQGRVKILKWNYEVGSYSMGSCNGLILRKYQVANPTTGQCYALPSLEEQSNSNRTIYSSSIMACAAAPMKYKVFVMCYWNQIETSIQSCAVLTVGVDRYWRHLRMEHLSITEREFYQCSPVIAGGFIHWIGSNRVLTMNVGTEVFTLTPIPQGYEKRFKYFLTTGSSLTMLVVCGNLSCEVWEFKQEESGEWMKQFKIDLEAQEGRIQQLATNYSFVPVGWLNYGEVLVLHTCYTPKVCYLYNVRTQEIDSFQLSHNFTYSIFHFHRNSLVHLVV